MTTDNSPGHATLIQDVYLKEFQRNNPHCEFAVEDDELILHTPWGSDDARLTYSLHDIDHIKRLNNLVFPTHFNAVIHIDANEIEFIYGYVISNVDPALAHHNRSFVLHYDGLQVDCRFAEPTDVLFDLAQRVRWNPSDPYVLAVPQLRVFRDAQNLDALPVSCEEILREAGAAQFLHEAIDPDSRCSFRRSCAAH